MSLDTLRADVRYQDARRRWAKIPLDVLDPAVGRQLSYASEVMSEMLVLAIEHGWDPEGREWQ